MNILFSNTFYQKQVEYTSLISVIPPLDLAYCAALVRKHVPKACVSILDANVLKLNLIKQLEHIKNLKPDILIFTAATHSINAVKYICQALQGEKIIKILIGSHGSAFPKETLKLITELDIVVYGEPEITVSEIVQSLAEGKELSSIRGIYYRNNGVISNTEPRNLLKDLDELIFPARDLLPNRLYFSPYSSGVTAIQTTRGCPGQCTFCDSHLINGQVYRERNPDRVVEEIEECLRKYKIKYFAIIDHTFTANRAFVAAVCNGIIRKNIHKKIHWACNTRVDMLTDQLALLMKQAGCIQVGIGIESGYNAGLTSLRKNITETQIKEAIQRLKRVGIIAMGYAIIGFPKDSLESIEETKKRIFDFNPHTLQLSFATPLPGSDLYEYCRKDNRIISNNWDDYCFLRKSIILNDSISCEDLARLRRKIIKQFYFRLSKIIELIFFFIFRVHLDYINCFKGVTKIALNIRK